MIPSLLITGPSTGAGKTVVARALTTALTMRGARVAALKPIETGVDPDPADALALARAAHNPALAYTPAFYRAKLPLAPYAVALETDEPAPDLASIVAAVRAHAADADALLVEGAGGLLVPLDARHCFAELAVQLGLPLLLVARDQLGVLSHLLTCHESAAARGLRVAGVVLVQHESAPLDPSARTNQRILQQRLACPVLAFPACPDATDAELGALAERGGMLEALALV